MEYTFKNSLSARACTVLLGEYQLTWQIAGREAVIPYSSITAIHLSKKGHTRYGIRVDSQHQRPIWITNVYFLSRHQIEDRSRQFGTFVRILHLHLSTKSKAVFRIGFSPTRLVACGAAALFLPVAAFFGEQHVAPGLFDYFLGGSSVVLLTLAGWLLLNRNWVPKNYPPTDIPLEFLP